MLLKLIDGGIMDFQADKWHTSGCETCDYGSNYTNEVDIPMVNGSIRIEISQSYEYALSQGYMMQLFLRNLNQIEKMTEREFFEWLHGNLVKDFSESLDVCTYH